MVTIANGPKMPPTAAIVRSVPRTVGSFDQEDGESADATSTTKQVARYAHPMASTGTNSADVMTSSLKRSYNANNTTTSTTTSKPKAKTTGWRFKTFMSGTVRGSPPPGRIQDRKGLRSLSREGSG